MSDKPHEVGGIRGPGPVRIDPERMPLWTVYDHPSDFPNHYVARLFHTLPEAEATAHVITSENVEAIRAYLAAQGCTQLGRHPVDDPKIMETWLC